MHNDIVLSESVRICPMVIPPFTSIVCMKRNSYVSFFFLKISCEKCPEFRGWRYNERTCLQKR